MTVVSIPVFKTASARWKTYVDLDGQRYGIYISWNTRAAGWFFTLMDSNDVVLIAGIRMVAGVYFLQNYKASVPNLPPGDFTLGDTETMPSTANITWDNLGTRFILVYCSRVDE